MNTTERMIRENETFRRQQLAQLDSADRSMVAKFPGRCTQCRQEFAAGTPIIYNTLAKKARHASCTTTQPVVIARCSECGDRGCVNMHAGACCECHDTGSFCAPGTHR